MQDMKDSEKIKIQEKTKIPRVADEGWNSQLSGPVEKKTKEKEEKSP